MDREDLLDQIDDLETNIKELREKYEELIKTHNQLLDEYSDLQKDYETLDKNYEDVNNELTNEKDNVDYWINESKEKDKIIAGYIFHAGARKIYINK
jgi:regulator of replication initiation timing